MDPEEAATPPEDVQVIDEVSSGRGPQAGSAADSSIATPPDGSANPDGHHPRSRDGLAAAERRMQAVAEPTRAQSRVQQMTGVPCNQWPAESEGIVRALTREDPTLGDDPRVADDLRRLLADCRGEAMHPLAGIREGNDLGPSSA